MHHEYEDKYLLAEYLVRIKWIPSYLLLLTYPQVNTAAAAQLNALEAIGVTEKHLAQLREWSKHRSISLRLRAEEKTTFLRKVSAIEEQSD